MYIDPSTGGLLFQALALMFCAFPLVALFIGGGVVALSFFMKRKKDRDRGATNQR